jgi:hypothetical protein
MIVTVLTFHNEWWPLWLQTKIPKTNTDWQATAANLQQTLVLCFFLLLWPAIGVTTEIMWTFQRRAELQPTTVAGLQLRICCRLHPGQPWPIIVNTFLVYLEGALPYPQFNFYLKRWQEMEPYPTLSSISTSRDGKRWSPTLPSVQFLPTHIWPLLVKWIMAV